ncbi:MAG: class I tRNA ligase family protein, partial [Rickettsiales bacterium]|nr:class I tRNA ligase family protein [Rickettsiales bacterium]
MLDNRFDFAKFEKEIYEAWEKSGAFKTNVSDASDNPDENFSIMMPPLNVTGSAHLGHAMENSMMDVLVRFNRMKGKTVLWQAGTDHAGIMTQMVVEKQMDAEGISKHDLGREKFLERMWQWKEISGGMITKQLRSLGISPDW